MTWIVVEFPGPGPFQTWAVARVDDAGALEHTHPIYFPYQREADRAAARLNLRDSGELVMNQLPTEDALRAVRQARIAELRAKRQTA